MSLVTLQSSLLDQIGYDEATQEMVVLFKTGGRYVFVDVPHAAYLSLMSADSVGKHFLRNIKGKFEFRME